MPKGVLLQGISTPERFMQVLEAHCNIRISRADVDAATVRRSRYTHHHHNSTTTAGPQLRMQGNDAARSGRLNLAIDLYTQALELNPPHGMHLLFANRSGARLSVGDAVGAVQDAEAALRHAPPDFSTAVVRLVDALYACKQYEAALQVLKDAPQATQPAFVHSSEYITLKAAVEAAASQHAPH